MARKKAQALPQPEPEMFTVHGNIVQETEDAILLVCGAEQYWLPKSQVEYAGERGDENVEVSVPDWLAEEKGLRDGQGQQTARRGDAPAQAAEASEDAPKEVTEATVEEQGDAESADTTDPAQVLRFKADVTAFGEDGYTLTVLHKEVSRDFHFRKEDLRYESDDIVDLQVGYSGLEFLVTWDVAAETGLVDFIGASLPAPVEDEKEGTSLVAEIDRPDTLDIREQPQARPYRHKLRRETVTASVQLTPMELNECARRITDALSERNHFKELSAEFSAKARASEKEAYKAAEVFEMGEEERRIDCDVVADFNAGQLVFVERAAPYREVKRLPMTDRDRQLTLFDDALAEKDERAESQDAELPPTLEASVESTDAQEGAERIEAAAHEEEHSCDTCAHDCNDESGIVTTEDDACEGCDEKLCNWKSRLAAVPRECSNCAHTYRTYTEDEEDPCRKCSDEGRENWMAMEAAPPAGGVEQRTETAVVQ